MQRRVEVIPAEHLERRQILSGLGLREMGEADLPLIALAVVRDEEQVVYGPGGTLGAIGGLRASSAPLGSGYGGAQQRGAGLGSKFDEEDAPGLASARAGAGA